MTDEIDPGGARADAFAALGLSPDLCERIRAAGYRVPTPIQREAIPQVLGGRDLLGCAQTGTGKTAAFALPILQGFVDAHSPTRRRIRTLVLEPTRELASQTRDSFARYAPADRIRCRVIFGGVGKQPQVSALRRGIDVLVATPGRLLDLLGDGEVELAHVETFVLDEADRMLDMGFIRDVRKIIERLPRERQTLLFSATMPKEIADLSRQILRRPVRVTVDPVSSTVEPIAQSVYFVERGSKIKLLLELLRDERIDRALVFTRTKRGANRIAEKLVAARIGAAAIHGNKSQSARERALGEFKSGLTRVVVATDLASRGIDVKDLSHVINFDLPNEPEVYVHRVGRTGRAGASGIALTLCASEERPLLAAIERLTQRPLERLETPERFAVGDVRRGERTVPAAPQRRTRAAGRAARTESSAPATASARPGRPRRRARRRARTKPLG